MGGSWWESEEGSEGVEEGGGRRLKDAFLLVDGNPVLKEKQGILEERKGRRICLRSRC